jgi:hypothetical protein
MSRAGSTGLDARTYNWFTRIQQARELAPKVAVFSFGADDAHDLAGAAGEVRRSREPVVECRVLSPRRRSDAELDAKGVYVVWFGLPIPDGPDSRRAFRSSTASWSRFRRRSTGAAYVDNLAILETRTEGNVAVPGCTGS